MFHCCVFLFQIGTQGALAHNDGMMGDIGFKCPTGKWTQNNKKHHQNTEIRFIWIKEAINWFLCVVLKSQENYGFPCLESTLRTHIYH